MMRSDSGTGLAMLDGHRWLVPILEDMIAYCDHHEMTTTAAHLAQARAALIWQVGTQEAPFTEAQEEQWFGEIVDDLARYCHHHGLDEVKERLLGAQEAWHAECHPAQNTNILTFPTRGANRAGIETEKPSS